jgi:hypothetical protein
MASEELSKVLAANRTKGGRHSPLYRWMRLHHDALASAFESDGVSWQAVTEMLAETGLTDGSGKAPAIRRAQKAWYQVKRDVATARSKAEAKHKSPVSIAVAAAPPLPSPVPYEPRRPAHPPPAVSLSALPAGGGDDDPLVRLRRTLNERSGRY